jgi:hypothetical protein
MIVNIEMGSIWKEAVVTCFKIILQDLSGDVERRMNHTKDSWSPGSDSNPGPPSQPPLRLTQDY